MDRSRSEPQTIECQCGGRARHSHWWLIDEPARPDLLGALRAGTLRQERCPRCRRTIASDLPVTVLRKLSGATAAVTFAADEASADGLDEAAIAEAAGGG